MCDSSHNRLGEVLEQLGPESWRPISFASRYLSQKNYSNNELEKLAVVWGAENFRKYKPSQKTQVIADHKALDSLQNGDKKKNMFGRLTR